MQSGSKPEEAVTERYSRKESQSGEAKRRGRKESQTGKSKKEKQQAVLVTKSMLNGCSAKGHTKEFATMHQNQMKAGLSERLYGGSAFLTNSVQSGSLLGSRRVLIVILKRLYGVYQLRRL